MRGVTAPLNFKRMSITAILENLKIRSLAKRQVKIMGIFTKASDDLGKLKEDIFKTITSKNEEIAKRTIEIKSLSSQMESITRQKEKIDNLL